MPEIVKIIYSSIIKSPLILLQAAAVIILPRYRQWLAGAVKVHQLVHSVFRHSSALREISDQPQFLAENSSCLF